MFKITRQALQGWEKFKFLKPYFSYEEFAVFTIFFPKDFSDNLLLWKPFEVKLVYDDSNIIPNARLV